MSIAAQLKIKNKSIPTISVSITVMINKLERNIHNSMSSKTS